MIPSVKTLRSFRWLVFTVVHSHASWNAMYDVIVHLWSEEAPCKKVMKIIMSLEFVNDAAQRRIAQDIIFNLSSTRREDDKHFLFQMVEMHHSRLPHHRESAASGTRTK